MDNYRMLAEHFGRNGQVRVIITGTQAKTDGKTIYLPENVPTEIQGVLLATLMHESYHIRLTDFDSIPKALKSGYPHRAEVLNALEDMRIDTLVQEEWPNAVNLYWDLLSYYFKAHGADFNALGWQVKVMRNLMMRAYKRPQAFERFTHGDAEVKAFEAAHHAALDSITARAKSAPNTEALGPIIDEVLALLFPADPAREKERQANESNLQARAACANGARAAQRGAQAAAKALHDQAVKDEAEAHEAEKEQARAEAEARQEHADGHPDRAAKADAKAAAAKAKAAAARKRRAEAQAELNALGREFENNRKIGDAAQADVDSAERAIQAAEELDARREFDGLKGLGEIGIGFDKIKAGDMVAKQILPENVEEEVREFLRMREARKVHAPEGRIDPMRLPTYYNPETLFSREIEDAHYKTRIHFLVDISGSMNSPLHGDSERARKSNAATQAVLDISKAIEQGINCDGLEIEFGIFGFDTEAHEIKGFGAELDAEAIRAGLRPRGGTNPLEVLKNVEGKNRPDCIRTRQIVFMLTDGEFGDDAYQYLERETSGMIQWVFIGIGVNDGGNKKARDLFGKFNVTRLGDLKKALGRALVEGMA